MLSFVFIIAVIHVLAFLPLSTAAPHPNNDKHAPVRYGPVYSDNKQKSFCKLENAVLAAVTIQAYKSEALAYCSSILSLPVVTETSTTTNVFTSIVFTETPLSTITIAPAPIVFNRNGNQKEPCVKPKPMSTWKDAFVTSACSCIASQIPLTTTTTTATTSTTYGVTSSAETVTITIQATPTCTRSPIVNGGFDDGPNPGDNNDPIYFTGWEQTIDGDPTQNSLLIKSLGYNTPKAVYASCVGPTGTTDQDQINAVDTGVILTQTLKTCVGVTYNVGFRYNVQGNSYGNPNNFLVVKANGLELQNIQASNGGDNRGVSNYNWSLVQTTHPIVATSEETVLEISFVCGYRRDDPSQPQSPSGTVMEWLFDGVTVTAVES